MFKKMFELFADLRKMDPALAQALANIRAGRGTAADANLLARGMYTDTMVPKMGNKMAYNDFLSRNGDKGYHVHADMNDFGQINKFHGETMGDDAIKRFGTIASEVSRMFGGKAFRNGGDEFKFWFHKPEHAHGFARELRARLEKHPKIGGTHNLAASIGIGFNRDHAESALLEAKKQLGPTVDGKRNNLHKVGDAPTVIHSKSHEAPPPGWSATKFTPTEAPKQTPNLAPTGLKFHNPLAKNAAPELSRRPIPSTDHPALSGEKLGIMTADNPMHPTGITGGNAALEAELRQRNLKFEKITGKYTPGALENSFIIYGVSPKDMMEMGKKYGQDSVIHSHRGSHRMIYTNGDKEGMFHIGDGHTQFDTEPEMFYSTAVHNGQPLHFAYNFDFDTLHASNVAPDAVQGATAHPHGYEWHDGHTDHHGEEVVKHDIVPPNPTKHPHVDGAIPKPSTPHINEQAAGKGVKTYAKFAAPYGEVKPGTKSNLFHYDYRPHEDKINHLLNQHGFQVYIAGGKHGKPDLASRNYNTGHLMIYDPTPSSGGDFGDEAYTRTWRTVHELSHGLTYGQLNSKYGEGRRIGKLGTHRTPREAKRAVEWEWLAAHKQREITEHLTGQKVPDELFHRELNTVMHDAVHRAVTGQFTEPSDEGFVPHSHKVPLEVALGMIDNEARSMGLAHDDAILPKKPVVR